MIKRITSWLSRNDPFKWTDTGEEYAAYKLNYQTEHVAHVFTYRIREQVHEDTGEKREKEHQIVGVKEPLSQFDENGVLWPEKDAIPPLSESDRVDV